MQNAIKRTLLLTLLFAIGGGALAGVTSDPNAGYVPSEPSRCGGVNLLSNLASSDPVRHSRILEAATSLQNGQHLLWKIERPGLAPSYLFGTVHLTDTRVRDISPQTRAALRSAKAVLLETSDISPESTAAALVAAAKTAVYADGRTLDRLLTKEEFKKVQQTIDRAGVPAASARVYRPWMISMMLSGSNCERRRIRAGEPVLDMALAQEARIHGIPITGLETAEEQIRTLASVPEDQQLDMLRANLAIIDETDNLMETMVQLYLERRIGAVWELQMALAETAGIPTTAFDGFRQAVIVDRNIKMYETARSYFETGGTFMAVGALHLPGEDGLVALLRNAGYTVTPVE